LQLGSGNRDVPEWLNLDLEKADINIDFSQGKLPFKDCQFETIVSQHLIEHLDIEREVMPLMREVHRVLATKGEFWVSCPDIEKICESYMDNKCEKLIEGRKKRDKDFSLEQFPSSMFINTIFYQNGEHKNLFDFGLLEFVLKRSGFHSIEKVSEYQMLNRFKE